MPDIKELKRQLSVLNQEITSIHKEAFAANWRVCKARNLEVLTRDAHRLSEDIKTAMIAAQRAENPDLPDKWYRCEGAICGPGSQEIEVFGSDLSYFDGGATVEIPVACVIAALKDAGLIS